MCTLSYLPSGAGFVLVNSRDEAPSRGMALPPDLYDFGSKGRAVFPQDKSSGGTWLATADAGLTLCLLNGAFEKHTIGGTYRHSRGLVIPQFLASGSLELFMLTYDCTGLEPFTLVVLQHAPRQLDTLRWDGQRLHRETMDASEPHLWSSATLYDAPARALRQQWFGDWLQKRQPDANPDTDLKLLQDFHFNGGETHHDPATRINSWRPNGPVTVAISSLIFEPGQWTMQYHHLASNSLFSVRILDSLCLVA